MASAGAASLLHGGHPRQFSTFKDLVNFYIDCNALQGSLHGICCVSMPAYLYRTSEQIDMD